MLMTAIIAGNGALFADEVEHTTKAGVEFAYYVDDHRGQDSDGGWSWPNYVPKEVPDDFVPIGNDEGRVLGSGWGSLELQAYLQHSIKVPVMQGSGPLTKDNNITFSFKGSLAPVVAYVQAKTVLTPIAFLNFEAGYSIGTGWNGLGFNGIGLNNDGSGNPLEDSFAGAAMEAWVGGTFQFDFAALFPGEWNHVVTVANAKFQYINYTEAEMGDAWQWKADAGENHNGYRFLGTYLIGYQMPLLVDTVGLMLETDQNLGDVKEMSPMDEGGWGSDFVKMRFGPLVNLGFNDNHSLTILLQMKTARKYTDETVHYNYFKNREYDSTYVKLERLALAYTYKF